MRNFCIHNTRWRNKEHEFDDMASRIVDSGQEFYLVGNRDEVLAFYQEFKNKIVIKGCILSSGTLSQEGILSLTAEKARGILSPLREVLICVSFERDHYMEHLKGWALQGYRENITFFQADVFRPVFYFYKYGKLHLDRVEIFLTSYCTLNCEKCIAYIPYFKKRRHMDLDMLIQDLDLLFTKIDFIGKLKLLGGEGLLYPYIIEYLDYLFAHYSDRVGTVRIGTNATILPAPPILERCRRYGVIMDVSDYAQAVPGKCRFNDLLALLKEEKVGYSIKRTGEQWFDIGFPTNAAEFVNEDEIIAHFHQCAMFCREFCNGKLYFCCSNFAAVEAGIFPAHENDYLDFRGHISKREILEYEAGFSHLGYTTFCRVCRGCSVESNMARVPVARQVGK